MVRNQRRERIKTCRPRCLRYIFLRRHPSFDRPFDAYAHAQKSRMLMKRIKGEFARTWDCKQVNQDVTSDEAGEYGMQKNSERGR